jgi:hypothetical protein
VNFNAQTKMTLNPDTMKRLAVFSFALLITSFTWAQTIKVVKKDNRIKGNMALGYGFEIEGKSDDVEGALSKFLKEYGKPRSTSEYISVSAPTINGTVYDGNTLYATATGDNKKSQVWIGLDTTEWKARDFNAVLDKIEKMTYQFGVRFYRDGAQRDIDESQRAFEATEKQKVRITNQTKDLNIRLANNDQERIQLEKSLEANKLEKAVLLQKLENNRKSQDSVANAGSQIKKVMESQKERQKKIN